MSIVHVTLLFNGAVNRDALCAYSKKVLASPHSISTAMGMDGMIMIVDDDDGSLVQIEQIVECKTGRSRNAIFGTYMLSEDLFNKGIQQTFCIVHPTAIHMNQKPLTRMRDYHKHRVFECQYDAPDDDIKRVYADHFVDPTTSTEAQPTIVRVWQKEQNAIFLDRLRGAPVSPIYPLILRLYAVMGAGKSKAIAMNVHTAPKVYQLRVVCSPSVSGLKHLLREMADMGVDSVECDYKTSHGSSGMFEDDEAELANDAPIRRIAHMIKEHGELLEDENAARPPVLACLIQTLPVLIQIMQRKLDITTRMLLVMDEAHACTTSGVIGKLLQNPYITTLQVSGTFYNSDIDLFETFPKWCIQPYYTYSYDMSVRDGHNVPLNVYFFENAKSSMDRIERLKNILLLHPGTTIVATSSIKEARTMRKIIEEASLGYGYIACAHSEMGRSKAHLDNAVSPTAALNRINANTDVASVLLTVRMARTSLNVPSAMNFVDFRQGNVSVDTERQTQGRVMRAFSFADRFGNIVCKKSARYFVEARQREVTQYGKYLFDDGNNINIYDVAGKTLEEMAHATIQLRNTSCARSSPRTCWKQMRTHYRHAFFDLAFEAIQYVKTASERRRLKNDAQWITVPFLAGQVSADLRRVVDDIVKVYNKAAPALSLPDDFEYPHFATNANAGRHEESVPISSVRLTDSEKEMLRTNFAHDVSADVWSDIERASIGHLERFRNLKTLWQTGTASFRNQSGTNLTIVSERMHGFNMSIDVEDICRTDLSDETVDGVFFEKDFLRWMMQRFKLKQLEFLQHPRYEDLARREANRIKRKEDKHATSSIVGQKRMHDYLEQRTH